MPPDKLQPDDVQPDDVQPEEPTAMTTESDTRTTDRDDVLARLRRLEDAQAIGQLRARYCQCLDDGRWDELAALFTPDGAFVGLATARGRDELREFFAGLRDGPLSAWWHFSANETVEVDGDTATGQTWLFQPCVVQGEAHIAAGRYRDRMARVEGRWLFAERAVTFFFWTPLVGGWAPGRMGWPPAAAALDERYTLESRRQEEQPG
ncbi:MAG TPA: nuclear transport factor 2 family protein [Pseudonocardia sp.]